MRLLMFGAGLAARRGGVPSVLSLAGASPQSIDVRVFDRAELRPDHIAHPAYADGGEPGQPKATALAAVLARAGVAAAPRLGDVGRWPEDEYRADLALVALDCEVARATAHARLRAAGTRALVVGIASAVSVHVFGGAADDACYRCAEQRRLPRASLPCQPGGTAARSAASAAAEQRLAAELPRLLRSAAAGRELGTFHAFPAGDAEPVRAVLRRRPDCPGWHTAPPTAPLRAVPASVPLGAVLAEWPGAALVGARLRHRYLCRDCGCGDQRGADLVRAWPARERCRCGSAAVEPLLRLDRIDAAEATRLGLGASSLQDLGMPAGFGARVRRADGTDVARLAVVAAPPPSVADPGVLS